MAGEEGPIQNSVEQEFLGFKSKAENLIMAPGKNPNRDSILLGDEITTWMGSRFEIKHLPQRSTNGIITPEPLNEEDRDEFEQRLHGIYPKMRVVNEPPTDSDLVVAWKNTPAFEDVPEEMVTEHLRDEDVNKLENFSAYQEYLDQSQLAAMPGELVDMIRDSANAARDKARSYYLPDLTGDIVIKMVEAKMGRLLEPSDQ